jgi:hypothetical protein
MANSKEACPTCKKVALEAAIETSDPLLPAECALLEDSSPRVRVRRLSFGKVHWISPTGWSDKHLHLE